MNWRTNNALEQQFGVNSLNQLTTVSRAGTLTVAGTTAGPATNVTVNSLAAELYGDGTFARAGFSLLNGTNTFTAVASDSYGRTASDTTSAYLPESAAFTYDQNGNLLSDGRRGFEYDDENQLIRVTFTNAWKSEFGSDGRMRRCVRREAEWTGSDWATNLLVQYVYDGNLVIQERHFNPQISAVVPQRIITYTRGQDLSGTLQGAGGIGGLLARSDRQPALEAEGTHAYFHADGNGNVTALTDADAEVAAKYLYDPFGNILSQSGPLAEANPYRFSSKEFHAESGLVYYGYRFYEPNLQRWINRDPLGEAGGLNLYAIIANNPIERIDAFGLSNLNSDPTCTMLRALADVMMGVDPNVSFGIHTLWVMLGCPDNPIRRPTPPGAEQHEVRWDPSFNRRWECIKGGPRAPLTPAPASFRGLWEDFGPFGRTVIVVTGAAVVATGGAMVVGGGSAGSPAWGGVLLVAP